MKNSLCPLCHGRSYFFLNASDVNRKMINEKFSYYQCRQCGIIFLWPIPANMGDYYPNDYYQRPKSLHALSEAAKQETYKIDIVKRFVFAGRLLEIGPSYGAFAFLAKGAGFNTEVIEMDESCCAYISDKIGIKAICSDRPEESMHGQYDAIVLWHTIEHVKNPIELLRAVSERLSTGGVLIISAPNPASFQFRVLGKAWTHLDAPRHLNLIPMHVLYGELLKNKMHLEWYSTKDKGAMGWNVFGWVKFFSGFSDNKYLKFALSKIGILVAFVLSPIEQMDRNGSTYTMVFRKGNV